MRISIKSMIDRRREIYVETKINLDEYVDYRVDVLKIFNDNYLFDCCYDSQLLSLMNKIDEIKTEEADMTARRIEYIEYFHRFYILLCAIRQLIKTHEYENSFSKSRFSFTQFPSFINTRNAIKYLKGILVRVFQEDGHLSESEYIQIAEDFQDSTFLEKLLQLNDDRQYFERFERMCRKLDDKLHKRTNRCVAFAELDGTRYVAISGCKYDYEGKAFEPLFSLSPNYSRVYKAIKDIFPYDVECHLTDDFVSDLSGILSSRTSLKNLFDLILERYACCERKMVSYFNSNWNHKDLKLLVKFAPCEKCVPFLDGVQNIICTDRELYTEFLKGNKSFVDTLFTCSIMKKQVYLKKYSSTSQI
ncbi:MAG: hypothetical protein IJ194_07755 [Bacilli bacterium]|nr:hypothetical protein [Bacilli bacterium]